MKVRSSSRPTGVVSPVASQLSLVLWSEVCGACAHVATNLLQALVPLAVTGVPMLIGLALMASRAVAVGSLVGLLSGLVACMPVVSPVFTMLFLRSYRRVLVFRRQTY